MREGRQMLTNDRLRAAAMAEGLREGCEIIVRERSLLKDGSYITRIIRRGRVLKLYEYHFSCRMATGERESFRYNELLGWEARLIRVKRRASQDAFFFCAAAKKERFLKNRPKGLCLTEIYGIFLLERKGHQAEGSLARRNASTAVSVC